MYLIFFITFIVIILYLILVSYFKPNDSYKENDDINKLANILDSNLIDYSKEDDDDNDENDEIDQTEEIILDKDILNENEIIFLKFMNNKNTDIAFSSRWEWQYNIEPSAEVKKLILFHYLEYSNASINIKSSTVAELKKFLKDNNQKVTGKKEELINRILNNVDKETISNHFTTKKYVLSQKGKEIIDKNKILFMSDREKAGKDFEELTDSEYTQLQVFNKVNEYKRLRQNELTIEKGYSKNDVLWSIYNKQNLIYFSKRDYDMASIVYMRMYELLYSEKKYDNALHYFICALYLSIYNILPEDGLLFKENTTIGGVNLYERRLNKHINPLKKLLKLCDKDIDNFDIRYDFFIKKIPEIIKDYLPSISNNSMKVNAYIQIINTMI